uniref:Uncharacterized protein n=1 Tax=Glossina morsitans morsitans TaxID=37546 RepID=A0A1B0G6K7_GLOMM
MAEQIRYEEEIMSLADSRSYVQTLRVNFDNLASSQNFTSCQELLPQSAELSTNGSEFHITDTQLIECCNKVEAATKEVKKVNNIDASERGDKPIVDIIFEDFSTTPFNSPTSSPERSALFILREKPKRFYSRKKKLDSKKSSDSILETPDLDYNDIEKKDTHNENEDVVETGISEWDEDDNDLFLSISAQQFLDQNNFPSTSKRAHKFPANKQITQGNQRSNKNLVLSESNFALGFQKATLGEDKNELNEVTNKMHQDEEGKVNNPDISLVPAGFETANGK